MAFLANNLTLSIIVTAIAIFLFFFMTFKGCNLMLSALVASLVMCLVSTNGWQVALTTDFITGCSTLLNMMMLLFLSGSLLGTALEITGSSQKIGDTLVRWFGEKNVIWVMFIFYLAISLAGCGMSIFLFWAFCLPLLRKADLPKSIPLIISTGLAAVTGFMINFAPVPINAMYAEALGTGISFSNGPLLSVICTVIGLAMLLYFCFREQKRARAEGRGYHREGEIAANIDYELRPAEELPCFAVAIAPVILVLALVIVLQDVFHWHPGAAAVTAQLVVTILVLLVNWKKIKGNLIQEMAGALLRPVPMIMAACCVCGFATILSTSLAYGSLLNALSTWSINPYVLTFISIAAIAAISADSVTPSIFFLSTLVQPVLAMGANPAAVQRIAMTTSTTFDSLPHSYMVSMHLQCWGYDIKSGYKYVFQSTVIMTTIVAVIATILSIVLY